jgi:hypothetical protein
MNEWIDPGARALAKYSTVNDGSYFCMITTRSRLPMTLPFFKKILQAWGERMHVFDFDLAQFQGIAATSGNKHSIHLSLSSSSTCSRIASLET